MQERDRRRETLEETKATATSAARIERNAHTTVYSQELTHPSCQWATRRLELWHSESRARLTLRFHRTANELPEVLFVVCDVPCDRQLPETSNGGLPFTPYQDQLPGTCQDFFTIDSWVHYDTPRGRWLWASRDAPLVTFGEHRVAARCNDAPQRPGRILSMVFNNLWITNFVADSHGALEFQYDLAWQSSSQTKIDSAQLADTLLSEPQVVINPKLRSDPVFLNRLHRP